MMRAKAGALTLLSNLSARRDVRGQAGTSADVHQDQPHDARADLSAWGRQATGRAEIL